MGGLAVRAWLARFDAGQRVERVITVAAPHAGTWLARFAFSLNGSEMRRGGAWLRSLERLETTRRGARFTCFYSHCDNVVFPASTAVLPGADNRHVPGCAHVDLLFHPEVFSEVLRALDPASGRPVA
jgi:triacylglycerol esterase/lipase EstA (alpha/beta hydrolase family)